ncbi:MAG: carboxylesterase family protein [Polyangiaceae bacterium]|nr:carboxylesterase family protein [Polyangiaceae bacterium]
MMPRMSSVKHVGLACSLILVSACGDDTSQTGGGGGDGGGGGEGGSAPVAIETDSGPVEGFVSGATRVFLGLPYAAPPIGDLRFRPPAPVQPWTEPLEVISRGPMCPQLSPLNGGFVGGSDEDCLTLNVWSPAEPSETARPVMVWIHGGGFVLGSGGDAAYDGQALSEATGHVVVTLNYRLGPLGFLAHPDLKAEDPAHPSSGNYGLEDQRAALEWVQANIAGFGGDPGSVTIFGESAGGASVCHHLVSPGSAGLFHAAVLQSGPCDLVVEEAEAFASADALAVAVACDADDPLACLRDASPAELLTALPAPSFGVGTAGTSWYPVIDGEVLPSRPSDMLEAGDAVSVPVILGSNADEATMFFQLGGSTVEDEAGFLALAEQAAPGEGDAILAQYPVADYGSYQTAAVAAFSDAGFICPTRRAARALSSAGNPTYLYHFTYGPISLFGDLGAFHSAEIKFVLMTPGQLLPQPLTDEELTLGRAMSGYWSRLASGDPNGDGSLAWLAYAEATDPHIVFDLTLSTGDHLREAQCDFWDVTAPF